MPRRGHRAGAKSRAPARLDVASSVEPPSNLRISHAGSGAFRTPAKVFPISASLWLVRNEISGDLTFVDATLGRELYRVADGSQVKTWLAPDLARVASNMGLVLDPNAVLASAAGSKQVRPCEVGAVAIVTRSRPRMVSRILSQILQNRAKFGRRYKVIVVDQSPARERQAVRAMLESATKQYRQPAHYVGEAEIRALETRLARKGVANGETLAFLLRGTPYLDSTYGAALNAALLWTAGTPLALFDDDIVPRVAGPNYRIPGHVSLAADTDPTSLAICRHSGDIEERLTPSCVDPIEVHERILGANLAYVINRLGTSSSSLDPGAIKFLRLGSGAGRVAISALGIAGDCGLWSTHSYSTREGADREHMTKSDQWYKAVRHSRAVVRSAAATSIIGGGFLMNAAIAVDNRAPLAPFVPIGRNMDGIFAHCFECCFDDAFIGFVPDVVRHEPPSSSRRAAARSGSRADNAAVLRLSDYLIHAIRLYPAWSVLADGADKLEGLGYHLRGLASLRTPILKRVIRLWREEILTRHLRYLQRILETERAAARRAPSWYRDVGAQADAVVRALESTTDVELEMPASGRHANLGTVMMQVAESFLCWHRAWGAVRNAAQRGRL